MAWFPELNWSFLWNFNVKFHLHVVCGHGQKPNDYQRCHFQNDHLAAILDFQFEYQVHTSVAYYLYVWVKAYGFSVMSLSKWLPSGHIGYFGFWTLTLVWL